MKTYSQLIAETDSRMYGDDSVLKPKPPCKGKDCDKKKKKPKPFMGYEEVEAMKADPLSEGTSEKKEAMQSIADWKDKMKMVEDHIILQDKRLASMEKKLVTAEKKLQQGDYGWISSELFFNGDLF